LATLSFIKLVKNDQKMWSEIWRFVVASTDAAEKTHTTTIHHVCKHPKDVLENLLPV